MRKYMIFTLLSLLTLTSCIVDDGYKPAMNSVDLLLFDNVTRSIHRPILESKYIFYADALLQQNSAEAEQLKSKYLLNTTATVEDTKVVITQNYSDYVYTVVTDGTPLSEGGEWQLMSNEGEEETQKLLYTYIGVADASHTVSVLTEENKNSHNLTIQTIQVEKNLYFQVFGSGEILGYDYQLNYTIKQDAPFCYDFNIGAPLRGEIEMDYRDLVRNTTHHTLLDVKTDIDNYYSYYYYY